MRLKRAEILKEFPVTLCKDGSWFANIRFAQGPSGRKTIKKSTKEDAENAVVDFVSRTVAKSEIVKKKIIPFYSYKKAFEAWIKAQNYSENTEIRNRSEYRRFFERLPIGQDISERDIREILPSDIEQHMTTAVLKYNLSRRKAIEDYNMFYKYVFAQAVADRIIDVMDKPEHYIQPNRFLKLCREECLTPDEDRVISKDVKKVIQTAVEKDHDKKEAYMPAYACELSALTAMRCGELAGLMWKQIDDDVIHINQSMKRNGKTKEYYISTTKNKKVRVIPITDAIRDVLRRIKMVQKSYGKTGDYVFSTSEGYCTSRSISDYMYNKRVQYKIKQPISIHAQRRTVNSRMDEIGVPTSIRSVILGHTERVNKSNYTYDTTNLDYKKQMLELATGD